MDKIGFIYTTFATHEDALKAVQELVDSDYASCGNIMNPHTSIYKWGGVLKQENEVVVILKCDFNNISLLIDNLKEVHPYDIPCIVEIDAQSTPEFSRWLEE